MHPFQASSGTRKFFLTLPRQMGHLRSCCSHLSQHSWQSEWLQVLLFTIWASSWHTGQVSFADTSGFTVFLIKILRS